LKQSLHLISNAPRLGVRRFRHIAQQHGCCHDVLARSGEAADVLFWFPVLDNLSVYLSSPSTRTSAMRVWSVLLEDPLELGKVFAIFIKLCFELP
jgi:hypothetical protein